MGTTHSCNCRWKMLLLVVILISGLICSVVFGDENSLTKPVEPVEIALSETEALKVDNLQLRFQALQSQLQAIQSQYNLYLVQLAQQYKVDLDVWEFDEINKKFIKGAEGKK